MWELSLLLLGCGLFVGGALWNNARETRRQLQIWQDLVVSCGLEVVKASTFFQTVLKTRAGPLEVWIEAYVNTNQIIVKLVGPPMPLALPLLGAETRRLLLRVNTESPLEISPGELRIYLTDEQMPSVLPQVLDIARACWDPNPVSRLHKAKKLGPQGHGILLEIAEGVADDAVSTEAVLTLGQDLPFERALVILDHARGVRRLQTARACLEALGRSGGAAVDPLARVLALEKGDLATVAAQALGETVSPAAEPPLISALQREEQDLRVAAANALGRVGSVEAVLPLKEAAEHSRLDLEFLRAARQAITEIQSRLQGASPGQLSLTGAEAGQLSLAEAEAGQLSIATNRGGQLSISDEETPKDG
jgi:HEAT repeat protein